MEDINRLELDEDLIARKVRSERFRVFNDRLMASVLVAPLGIALAAWLQYLVAGWERAVTWALLIGVAELLVLGIGSRFRQSESTPEVAAHWINVQAVCAGLLGLTWGASVWFVWSEDRFLLYITTLCILVGVSNICMVVMSSVRRAMVLFSVGIFLPPLVQLAFIDNPVALQIGVGWMVMLVVQIRYAGELRQELIHQIDSSERNVLLLRLLSEASRELAAVNAQKESKNAELHGAMEQLNQLVTFDQLTGAYSRRFIFEQLERQVAISVRHAAPVSLIMFDLDHFKSVNDRYGHAVGDKALREAASVAVAQLREGDMLGRMGGEEFLVLLPHTNRDAANLLGERLRMTLAATTVTDGEHTIALPASFGVAELQQGEDSAAWVRRADAALYQAKARGRNTLVTAA